MRPTMSSVFKAVGLTLIRVKNCQNLRRWARDNAASLVDELLLLACHSNVDSAAPSRPPPVLSLARDVLVDVPCATPHVPNYLRADIDETLMRLGALLTEWDDASDRLLPLRSFPRPQPVRLTALKRAKQHQHQEDTSLLLATPSTPALRLVEVEGDLFSSRDSKAHCVSADQHQGAGIALVFRRRFGRIDELLSQGKRVGEVAYFENRPGEYIFTLITKEKYWHKPMYESVRVCLRELARLCSTLGVEKLSVPRLGCGLDGLEWSVVKGLMLNTLGWRGLEIVVYTI